MAQHDLVIDNGPGAAVRTDMVAALQALVTLSSGPIEPVAMYAGQFWLDTSVTPNGAIRMRNLSNTAWTFPTLYGDDRVGEIAMFAFGTPPTGWLKANGALVSRTTYAALFAKIGTQFGVGDGSTTFALPDLRGQFLRVWDDGRGVDSGRAFGSAQTGAFTNHAHTGSISINAGGSHAHAGTTGSAGSHAHSGTTGSAGSHSHGATSGNFILSGAGSLQGGTQSNEWTTAANTVAAGAHTHPFTTDTEASHTHPFTTDTEPAHAHTGSVTINASTTGSTETRPVNVALLACIRYA